MTLEGYLILPDSGNAVRCHPGEITVAKGVIKTVTLDEEDTGARPKVLISPGFVDTHWHLPQVNLIGAHGLPLLEWLEHVVFPAEAAWADVSLARSMAEEGIARLLSHGTTSFMAYATVHHASTQAALEVCREKGVRARVGQVLMDSHAPDYLVRPVDELVSQTEVFLQNWREGQSRVSAAVTPRFGVSCTMELMQAVGRLAADYGAWVQTHLSETRQECAFVCERFGVADYLEAYERAGLLTERSVFGHGIWLSESERSRIADAGTVIAHCPTANSFLFSGTMNRAQWLKEGVRLSLGSDIGAGYDYSMVRVARAMIEAAGSLEPETVPTAAEAWWQITQGNADAAGWCRTGRLEVGAEADLLVIEPDFPWYESHDPLGAVLFSWDDRWLKQCYLEGRVEPLS